MLVENLAKVENLIKQILIERYMSSSYAGLGLWVKECEPSYAITELCKELGVDIPYISRQDCDGHTHGLGQHSHTLGQHTHKLGDGKTTGT